MVHRIPHGYEHFVKVFIPHAVGLTPQGRGATPGYPEGPPVVTVYGGRGTGRTSLCEVLHDTHVNRLHVAKWPMRGARPVRRATSSDANPLTSRPLTALAWLVHELDMGETGFGSIEFPRLTYGLIAATTLYEPLDDAHTDDDDGDGDGPTLAALQSLDEKLRELRTALQAGDGTDRTLWDSLTAWLDVAIPLVTTFAPGLAPLEHLIREVIGQARRRGGQRLSQDALKWWDQRFPADVGTGIKKLLTPSRKGRWPTRYCAISFPNEL